MEHLCLTDFDPASTSIQQLFAEGEVNIQKVEFDRPGERSPE